MHSNGFVFLLCTTDLIDFKIYWVGRKSKFYHKLKNPSMGGGLFLPDPSFFLSLPGSGFTAMALSWTLYEFCMDGQRETFHRQSPFSFFSAESLDCFWAAGWINTAPNGFSFLDQYFSAQVSGHLNGLILYPSFLQFT